MSSTCSVRALAVLSAFASGAAVASTQLEAPIEERVRQAELVFEGTVTEVSARLSDPDAAHPHPIAHTFVTYRVERVLKGAVDGDRITLRFIGGPIEGRRYTRFSGVPLFDVGDRDVLLAKANLESACPLVDCGSGRFRMVEEMVVSEEGRRYQLAPGGELVEGPAMKLEAIDTHRMSASIRLKRVEVPPEGEVILDPRDPAVRAGFDPVRDFTPERFTSYLGVVVQTSHTPEELERSAQKPMRSADPLRAFVTWSSKAKQDAARRASAAAAPRSGETSSRDPIQEATAVAPAATREKGAPANAAGSHTRLLLASAAALATLGAGLAALLARRTRYRSS